MKNKIITALLATIISFALWVYVITVERTESEDTFYNVSVVLDGQNVLAERGLMITSDTDLAVTLKLAGNRSELNNLKSSDISAVVDLSRIYEAGEKSITYSVAIPGDTGIEVVSRNPDTVSLSVAEWATKEIPVELAYIGRVPDGYYVDRQNAKLDFNAINVTGPKDIINQIEMARITVDLTDRTETIVESLRYSLCDKEGNPIEDVSTVTTDQGEIKVTVSIQQVKDVKLTYTVVEGGGLTEKDVTITLDYESITVAGSAAALAGLEEVSLGMIDLGAMTESGQLTLPIKLPEGVTNQSGITEVTADVKLPELETRGYSVTKFRAVNVPKGMTAQIYSKVLAVTLRGRGPILDRIKTEDIIVVVDFTGAELGMASFAVTIEIQGFEDFDGVGPIEKYTVTAGLIEQSNSNGGEP